MRSDSGASRFGSGFAALAVLAAPFIALLYRREAGLVVMAIALGVITWLLIEALDAVAPRIRRKLRFLVVGNMLLAVSCLVLAAWLVMGN